MTNKDQSTHIIVGKIGSTYGVKGWVKIQSFTEPLDNIAQYSPWYLSSPNHQWSPIEVEEAKRHGDGLVVKFKQIETPEAVRLHTGKSIAILRSQMPPLKPNEYYWSDLTHLTVMNPAGETLGKVSHVFTAGSHDVLLVRREDKTEFAVPFLLNSVILSVDLDKKEIVIDWEPLN